MTGIIIAFKHLNFAKGILHSDWAGFPTLNICLNTGCSTDYKKHIIIQFCIYCR